MTAKIKLGKREHFVFLDIDDFRYHGKWKWCQFKSKSGAIYARRAVSIYENKYRVKNITLYLHREILLLLEPQPDIYHVCSHINGNTLDCRRQNLAWVPAKKNIVLLGGIPAHSDCSAYASP